MAHARRSPQHRAPSSYLSSPSTARRKTSRRVASRLTSDASAQFVSSPLPNGLRPPLVPLQANLRRLPSRNRITVKDIDFDRMMRESSHVTAGSKRKRVVSSNENTHTQDRLARYSKRRRTVFDAKRNDRHISSSEESQSDRDEMEMEIDFTSTSEGQDDSDVNEQDEEEADEGADSSDDFLINEASPKTLNKLLKKKLLELYDLVGLTEPADTLRKSEIVDAIINARDDAPPVPPSSPGRTDAASSEYQSSDDGNFAGDETDAHIPRHPSNARQLLRRATIHDATKQILHPKQTKGRSASLGKILIHAEASIPRDKCSDDKGQRRKVSARSSPTTSSNGSKIQAVPVTRLRSRQASGSYPDTTISTSPTSSKTKGKGKARQVEFSNAVEVHLQTPSKRSQKGKRKEPSHDSEPESWSYHESETSQPSPRRLRSKDRERENLKTKEKEDPHATPVANSKRRAGAKKADSSEGNAQTPKLLSRRVTLMRKAKGKNVKDSDLDDGGKVAELEDEEEVEVEEVEVEEEEEESDEEEDEVDELVSSASISPPPESHGRRIPTRRRALRSRPHRRPVPTGEEENEGDDEEEVEVVEEEDDPENDEHNESVGEEEENDEDEETIAVEPLKLRNGKIVGEEVEEDHDMEVDQESVAGEEDEGDDADDAASNDGSEISVDVEDHPGEQDQEEVMEEDVDLTVATAKMLVRLRRDDLVRLCESREIDPSGTKPQLAEALLQWRDRQANDSSPSSTGTVRPLSLRRPRRTRKDSSNTTTTTSDVPVLLRSHHIHLDEPRTPNPGKEKERESEDLELDLESLGLEDREIPLDKLTKLEKIGSGGFKDVYIGKLKGRKVAIAEFRGQLSAMDIKELKLLGAFNHPNIVRFLGVSIPENTKETPFMIVSELCSNGDLFDYIRNVAAPSLHKVLKLMLDIAHGLEYLHTSKPSIIHRDCKSSNILITAKCAAKIADFGLAKVKQSTRSMVRSLVGTVNWQAPELWTAHPKYNYKVDVFSCSMVFWEILQWHQPTKKFPWEGMNEHAIYDMVGAKRQRPSTAGLKKQWCSEVVELIEHMWAQDPQDRPDMTQVVGSLEELYARY